MSVYGDMRRLRLCMCVSVTSCRCLCSLFCPCRRVTTVTVGPVLEDLQLKHARTPTTLFHDSGTLSIAFAGECASFQDDNRVIQRSRTPLASRSNKCRSSSCARSASRADRKVIVPSDLASLSHTGVSNVTCVASKDRSAALGSRLRARSQNDSHKSKMRRMQGLSAEVSDSWSLVKAAMLHSVDIIPTALPKGLKLAPHNKSSDQQNLCSAAFNRLSSSDTWAKVNEDASSGLFELASFRVQTTPFNSTLSRSATLDDTPQMLSSDENDIGPFKKNSPCYDATGVGFKKATAHHSRKTGHNSPDKQMESCGHLTRMYRESRHTESCTLSQPVAGDSGCEEPDVPPAPEQSQNPVVAAVPNKQSLNSCSSKAIPESSHGKDQSSGSFLSGIISPSGVSSATVSPTLSPTGSRQTEPKAHGSEDDDQQSIDTVGDKFPSTKQPSKSTLLQCFSLSRKSGQEPHATSYSFPYSNSLVRRDAENSAGAHVPSKQHSARRPPSSHKSPESYESLSIKPTIKSDLCGEDDTNTDSSSFYRHSALKEDVLSPLNANKDSRHRRQKRRHKHGPSDSADPRPLRVKDPEPRIVIDDRRPSVPSRDRLQRMKSAAPRVGFESRLSTIGARQGVVIEPIPGGGHHIAMNVPTNSLHETYRVAFGSVWTQPLGAGKQVLARMSTATPSAVRRQISAISTVAERPPRPHKTTAHAALSPTNKRDSSNTTKFLRPAAAAPQMLAPPVADRNAAESRRRRHSIHNDGQAYEESRLQVPEITSPASKYRRIVSAAIPADVPEHNQPSAHVDGGNSPTGALESCRTFLKLPLSRFKSTRSSDTGGATSTHGTLRSRTHSVNAPLPPALTINMTPSHRRGSVSNALPGLETNVSFKEGGFESGRRPGNGEPETQRRRSSVFTFSNTRPDFSRWQTRNFIPQPARGGRATDENKSHATTVKRRKRLLPAIFHRSEHRSTAGSQSDTENDFLSSDSTSDSSDNDTDSRGKTLPLGVVYSARTPAEFSNTHRPGRMDPLAMPGQKVEGNRNLNRFPTTTTAGTSPTAGMMPQSVSSSSKVPPALVLSSEPPHYVPLDDDVDDDVDRVGPEPMLQNLPRPPGCEFIETLVLPLNDNAPEASSDESTETALSADAVWIGTRPDLHRKDKRKQRFSWMMRSESVDGGATKSGELAPQAPAKFFKNLVSFRELGGTVPCETVKEVQFLRERIMLDRNDRGRVGECISSSLYRHASVAPSPINLDGPTRPLRIATKNFQMVTPTASAPNLRQLPRLGGATTPINSPSDQQTNFKIIAATLLREKNLKRFLGRGVKAWWTFVCAEAVREGNGDQETGPQAASQPVFQLEPVRVSLDIDKKAISLLIKLNQRFSRTTPMSEFIMKPARPEVTNLRAIPIRDICEVVRSPECIEAVLVHDMENMLMRRRSSQDSSPSSLLKAKLEQVSLATPSPLSNPANSSPVVESRWKLKRYQTAGIPPTSTFTPSCRPSAFSRRATFTNPRATIENNGLMQTVKTRMTRIAAVTAMPLCTRMTTDIVASFPNKAACFATALPGFDSRRTPNSGMSQIIAVQRNPKPIRGEQYENEVSHFSPFFRHGNREPTFQDVLHASIGKSTECCDPNVFDCQLRDNGPQDTSTFDRPILISEAALMADANHENFGNRSDQKRTPVTFNLPSKAFYTYKAASTGASVTEESRGGGDENVVARPPRAAGSKRRLDRHQEKAGNRGTLIRKATGFSDTENTAAVSGTPQKDGFLSLNNPSLNNSVLLVFVADIVTGEAQSPLLIVFKSRADVNYFTDLILLMQSYFNLDLATVVLNEVLASSLMPNVPTKGQLSMSHQVATRRISQENVIPTAFSSIKKHFSSAIIPPPPSSSSALEGTPQRRNSILNYFSRARRCSAGARKDNAHDDSSPLIPSSLQFFGHDNARRTPEKGANNVDATSIMLVNAPVIIVPRQNQAANCPCPGELLDFSPSRTPAKLRVR